MASRARAARGRRNHLAGLMAEDCVERFYRERGAEVIDRRHRNAGGEIDIVAREGDVLVFVEVKKRGSSAPGDPPVSERQWRRLEAAANQYILSAVERTGAVRGCRFDVAVIGRDAVLTLYENARSFD